MFAAAFQASARPFVPAAMSGVYALYDDGWRSKLVLSVPDADSAGDGSGQHLSARYFSYDRFRGEYPAQAGFDLQHPRLLRVAVSDFNELAEQTYLGHCSAGPPAMIAGVTHWREQPFGFFARRGIPLALGEPTDRPASAAEFAGHFTLHCPGLRADVELTARGSAELGGTIRVAGPAGSRGLGPDLAELTGVLDGAVPHLARLRVDGELPVTLTLHLFSHSFTAMAGWAEQGSSTIGCYLTRCRWAL